MFHRSRPLVIALIGLGSVTAALTGIGPAAADQPEFCFTTPGVSDFNGDGFDDAAVGDPYATVNGQAAAGSVTLLFGGADGRIGEGRRTVITQASFGDEPEAGDHFGWDVALGTAGLGTDCADLLVGSPGEDLSGAVDAGVAHLVRDLPDDEGTPELEAFTLTQAEAGGDVEAGDEFGYSVAIGGALQEDGYRLVVGAPGENAGATPDVGAVNVWNLDLEPYGYTELRQGRVMPGGVRVPGIPEAGDRFGAALLTGSMDLPERDGDEVAKGLVIGAPGDTVSGRDGAGSVTVVHEALQSAASISQDSPGVPGSAETGDQFGASLALSPLVKGQPKVLAVGAPGEDAGRVSNTGSVTLFTNTNERFVPRLRFDQATAGVPGVNEAGDRFGAALAFGHRVPTLLVGVPTEDIGSATDAGAVQPVRVPGPTLPLEFLPSITESAPGTSGAVATGHQFGLALGALAGREENLLTISSVYAAVDSVYVLSDVTANAPRSWVAGPGANRFGWAVSN